MARDCIFSRMAKASLMQLRSEIRNGVLRNSLPIER